MAQLAAIRPAQPKAAVESFAHVSFSAITGVQAGRAYYVAMCPLKLIPKMFLFDEGELPAELRAQRTLNRARVPEIARYMIENPTEYVFSAITASVDGEVLFEPYMQDVGFMGRLSIPMTAKFIINDGQHRRAAIEEALKEKPELGDETIAVVLFKDGGLKRSQQMFADLNKHAVRPTKSIGILYDLRDPLSQLSRNLISAVPQFKGLTETQKTTISNRSIKLFTLSGIYQGCRALLNKPKNGLISPEEASLAIAFWTEVGKHIPEWELARLRKVSAAELRRDFIHSHGIALHALGIMGRALLASEPKKWKERLRAITKVDWVRSNTRLWEGRAMVAGKVSKAHNNVVLTAIVFKRAVGLDLAPEEKEIERNFLKRG